MIRPARPGRDIETVRALFDEYAAELGVDLSFQGFEAERDAFEAPILDKYEREGSPYHSTARLWDDGVIDPMETRRVLAMGIDAALNAPIPQPGFSLYRM